jgi:hypothetical protein
MSLFGISLVDLYGVEYLKTIINYIRDTRFYIILKAIFGYKEQIPEIVENPSRLKTINKTSTGNQKDSKIVE